MNIDLQQAWEMLGGETFLRTTIANACAENGVHMSADEIETVVREVAEQIPDIIEEVEQQAAQNMARGVARREYQRFCRQCGIKPNTVSFL